VFDPGLGLLRAGFLFSRYGFNFRGERKNKQREKNPAPGCGTYSRWKPRVKANWAEKAPKWCDLELKRRMASNEWRIREAHFAIRYSPFALNETNGFHRRCTADLQRARAKWLKTP
jgi:hypothetical protein